MSGTYAPGTVLSSEVDFSEALQVSRGAFREAMQVLSAKGLVESRPKTGTRVLPRSRWNLLDPDVLAWAFSGEPDPVFVRGIFELRAIVEPGAARIAAERHDRDDLRAMKEALAGMRRHTLATDAGRAAAAVRACLAKLPAELGPSLPLAFLPALPQTDFDALLWACDLNFVRGEDSLVRALWAGRPLVWQIYPQDDGAHQVKLQAFLDQIDAGLLLHQWHQAWNGATTPPALPDLAALFDDRSVQRAASALWQQEDLLTQLLRFVKSRARGGSA